ncbi:MAG: LamG-like jellyroll fold domain-containing protein [Spirochaetales bacterium]
MGKRTVLIILTLLSLALPLWAQEQVEFGRADGWTSLLVRERLVTVPGRDGFADLELEAFRHVSDSQTEILLHFDSLPITDAAGNFRVIAPAAELSSAVAQTGRQAILMDRPEDEIVLEPRGGSAFVPGMEWGSFTIEFWLYPVRLSDGETLLSWQAQSRTLDEFETQAIRVYAEAGRLQASFENFFVRPDGGGVSVALSSDRLLIPRRWSHHAIRFDEQTGLLEYLVNGRPEDITYVSETGRQDGSVFFPRIAALGARRLTLGGGVVAALDEFRIVRSFVEDLAQPKYPRNGGALITEYVDMGSSGSQLLSIDAEYDAPGLSDLFFYYRVSDVQRTASELAFGGDWIPVEAGEQLAARPGRFVQLRVEFYPDTRSNQTPRLSSLSVSYQPDPAPLPPTALRATPMDGSVLLEWSRVLDEDLAGYWVYYGTESGMYFGTGSASGESPIDVGLVTSFIVDGLENGELYFFAVSAYDQSQRALTAELSSEAAARPARVYR